MVIANAFTILEVMAPDPRVEQVLWQYGLDQDLVETVRIERLAEDAPLRWWLHDQRRLRTLHRYDALWVRLLDVPAALGARSYGTDGRVVVEVHDPLIAENDGRWCVEAHDGAVEVTATDHEPDLVCGVAELGTLYLGGHRPGALARAGRIQVRDADARRRLAAMLVSDPAPRCATDF